MLRCVAIPLSIHTSDFFAFFVESLNIKRAVLVLVYVACTGHAYDGLQSMRIHRQLVH